MAVPYLSDDDRSDAEQFQHQQVQQPLPEQHQPNNRQPRDHSAWPELNLNVHIQAPPDRVYQNDLVIYSDSSDFYDSTSSSSDDDDDGDADSDNYSDHYSDHYSDRNSEDYSEEQEEENDDELNELEELEEEILYRTAELYVNQELTNHLNRRIEEIRHEMLQIQQEMAILQKKLGLDGIKEQRTWKRAIKDCWDCVKNGCKNGKILLLSVAPSFKSCCELRERLA